jgi:hypothetical protein
MTSESVPERRDPGAEPAMRASDADREAVAATLNEALAVGRLDPVEFQSRLDATFAARTLAELEPITRDLPAVAPGESASRPDAGSTRKGLLARMDRGTRAAWLSLITASLVCTVVWALSGFGYFWPGWVAGPWGAVLLVRTLSGAGPQERPGRRDGERDHL